MKAKLHNGKKPTANPSQVSRKPKASGSKPAANRPWKRTSPDWLRRSEYKGLSSPMVGCMHSRRGKAPC